MIIGTGIDIVDIARIRASIDRHGPRFLDRVFSPEEQALAPVEAGNACYYAGRWACKEAVAKALGCGIGEKCGWRDIRVLRGAAGQPQVELHGDAARTAAAAAISRIHVSISHEHTAAVAFAVAEGDSC